MSPLDNHTTRVCSQSKVCRYENRTLSYVFQGGNRIVSEATKATNSSKDRGREKKLIIIKRRGDYCLSGTMKRFPHIEQKARNSRGSLHPLYGIKSKRNDEKKAMFGGPTLPAGKNRGGSNALERGLVGRSNYKGGGGPLVDGLEGGMASQVNGA